MAAIVPGYIQKNKLKLEYQSTIIGWEWRIEDSQRCKQQGFLTEYRAKTTSNWESHLISKISKGVVVQLKTQIWWTNSELTLPSFTDARVQLLPANQSSHSRNPLHLRKPLWTAQPKVSSSLTPATQETPSFKRIRPRSMKTTSLLVEVVNSSKILN